MMRTRLSPFLPLAAVLCGWIFLPSTVFGDDLERGFSNPPQAARPRTLWMWMNGNVTADGITRDLEAMKRVGLGGAMIFNIGEFIPKGPVDYGQDRWLELMRHAAREADRLELELGLHNCPGWSSSGGPWITPEMSMQRLVWSETRVRGGSRLELSLPQPFTRLNFYRDVRVLAFPSLLGEEEPFAESLRSIRQNNADIDARLLTDGDLATTVAAGPDRPVVLEFVEPFTARAVTIQYTSGGSTIGFQLESSDDGQNFKPVVRLTPVTPRAIEDASLVETFEPVTARFYRIAPNRPRGLCEVELHATPRIAAWNYKANHSYRSARDEALPEPVAREWVIDPEEIIDLTGRMDKSGRLIWDAPAGNWTILRFGHTPRGQENIAAPDAGIGLESDKLSSRATAFHFEHGLEPLLRKLGPLVGRSFTGLHIDSYEVGVQNWTAGMESEFRARNGYELVRWLPAMTGRFVGSVEMSERFLWDLRRTHAEMVADHYYGKLRELANQRGMRLFAEPYGAGPGTYDELQVAGRVDVPMGEFWAHFPWDDMMSIRLAASGAHVRGRAVVAGEAFTATEEQSRFLDHPFGLKTTGDLAFSLGLNQMYFHRYAHQPHPTAVPGMTMGPWGFNFDRNNSWFDRSTGWLSYLARSQFLLQQGTFVADVLYFTGEGSPQMSKRIVPEIPASFQFDAIDAEGLLRDARVEGGRIRLANAGTYRLLALPAGLKAMTPEVLRKLRDLVDAGATLLADPPEYSPTLRGYPESESMFQQLRGELWAGAGRTNSAVAGRVLSGMRVSEALRRLDVMPDFEFAGSRPDTALVWTHRRVGDTEIYFVANRQRRVEDVLCSFRVVGRQPELWHPESGLGGPVAVYDFSRGRTRVPLRLDPAESVFVVFRSEAPNGPVRLVTRNGERIIDSDESRLKRPAPGAKASSVTNDFTISVWIQPDTDLMSIPTERGRVAENGKSWVLPAPEGDRLHGPGHAALGIAAGRNGVIVAERTSDRLEATLVSRTPISGWTHVAVVCRDGKPSLYLNGKLDREGQISGAIVHPGIDGGPSRNPIYYFDGNQSGLELFSEALSAEQIAALTLRGVPPPEWPPRLMVRRNNSRWTAELWESGEYRLDSGAAVRADVPSPREVAGPWTVELDVGEGAPLTLNLTNLIGLQRHEDLRVRHFSGTARYRTRVSVTADEFVRGRRFWLDLGRVAVIANVRVNGRELGQLWKAPYRIDITSALRPGDNDIEIRVTTLLANRLIGDEQLPEENEYDPRTRAIRRLPEWFQNGDPKPAGGRTTFSTWKFFSASEPLVEAGLLGPVRILTSVTVAFN